MAKKKSTVTTRNVAFNEYDYLYNEDTIVKATVNSMTANTKKGTQNIKLLDMTDAVVKKGIQITEDALNNTTMIEINTDMSANAAKELAQTIATLSPYVNDQGELKDNAPAIIKETFAMIQPILKESGTTFNELRNMIIDYSSLLNKDGEYDIYDAPDKIVLNNVQHYNNCGIESTLNTLAMAGIIKMNKNLKDQAKVEKDFLTSIIERGLAQDSGELGVVDTPDGGTLPDDYRDILDYFGIKSTAYYMSNKADGNVYTDIGEFAYKISQGHGAVLGVCSTYLWNETKSETNKIVIDHAIAITGVVYNHGTEPAITDTDGNIIGYNTPVGFYVHDTGAWMTRFISLEDFKKATLFEEQGLNETAANYNKNLREYDAKTDTYVGKEANGFFTTITDEPIKAATFNIDATGDKYDNIIWGNNSENTIKGLNGNDTLYGNGGNDTIYGGNGNDVIVGNNAYNVTYKIGNETFTFDVLDDVISYIYGSDKTLSDAQIKQLLELDIKEYDLGTISDISDIYKLYDMIPSGKNDIYGGAGNDIIIGGDQADLIYGEKGNDYIYGGDGRNAIYGGAGHDVIVGGFDYDRIFGDAGNDYIYGLTDDDTIDGGAGNDHLFGGDGNDRIETGKGIDTVYFEGQKHGVDEVSSKAGSTQLVFNDKDGEEGHNASDMFISIEQMDKSKKLYDLKIMYEQGNKAPEEAVEFLQFYNITNNKSIDVSLVDRNKDLYTISASSNAKVSVANTKMTGTSKINGVKTDNSKINNIFVSTNTKGTTITTSDKNDIVTMISGGTILNKNIDEITYTGGADKYVSEERDTYYTVAKFDEKTSLSIYDNIISSKKVEIDIETFEEIVYENYTSKDDKLYFSENQTGINLLFDVELGSDEGTGYTTVNDELYILKGNNYSDIVNGNGSGFIYMDSFFKQDSDGNGIAIKTSTGVDPNFYGNGLIEHMYTSKDTDGKFIEFKYTDSISSIASAVAGWLSNTTTLNTAGYDSAFEAFEGGEGDIAKLIACYTGSTNA